MKTFIGLLLVLAIVIFCFYSANLVFCAVAELLGINVFFVWGFLGFLEMILGATVGYKK